LSLKGGYIGERLDFTWLRDPFFVRTERIRMIGECRAKGIEGAAERP
jgi:hypothetical protein